jgi:PAS domain S-box-containing protein
MTQPTPHPETEVTELTPPHPRMADAPASDPDLYRRQLETVAENATLALFIMDEHQRCTYMNRAAEELTGFRLEELQGKELHYYIHHTRPDGSHYPLEECPIDQAFPQNMREQGEEVFVHKDGHLYPVSFTASPIRRDGVTVGTIIEARDITAERHEQREAEARGREAELTARIGTTLTRGGPLRQVLQGCAEAITEQLQAAFARIWTLDEEEQVLELQASAGMYTHLDGPHGRVPVGAFKIGKIAQEAAPHLTNNVLTDERVGDKEWARREGMVSFAGYPLMVEGRVIGVIAMFARHTLSERTMGALASVADGIALAIDRARMEEARERLLGELEFERTRLAGAFEQAPAFIATLRGPDHVFEMANPIYAQLVGHRDVVGKPVREAIPEAAGQGFLDLLDQVYRDGEAFVGNGVRIELQRTPGAAAEARYLNFVYQPLTEADGSVGGILVHGVDVTEQVETQRMMEEQAAELEAQKEELQLQALRMEEVQVELEVSNEELQRANEETARERTHLAAIIDHAPVGILIAEAPTGRIVMGNRRLEEIVRHPVLQSAGVEEYDRWVAFHRDGRRVEGHEFPLARVFATGRPAGPDEYLYQRGDGTAAWVQITGVPLHDIRGAVTSALVVLDDVDAERRAQEERESLIRELGLERARLRTVFQQAPAMIAVLRGPEFVFEMANRPYVSLMGGRPLVGKKLCEAVPEVVEQGFIEMLNGVYATGEPHVGNETPALLDRTGQGTLEEGFFNFVFQALPDADGSVGGILIHAVDVTDQVHARREVEHKAQELARIARALETSNRELDQFAYVASHDLKAPLRGISNISTWIEEDLEGVVSAEVKEHLELLRGRVHRMEGLIEGILQYSRAGRMKERAVRVDTAELVEEVVELIAPPEGVRVEVAGGMPVVHTERLPLQQVFMNLIGNAVKYARGDAPLVRVESRESEGGMCEFAVIDNGPGIAPEYHERIFGIFQMLEARDKVEGTGIGLSIVKKLVESRGGRVWVESEEGAGSTFRFLWPQAHEESTGNE